MMSAMVPEERVELVPPLFFLYIFLYLAVLALTCCTWGLVASCRFFIAVLGFSCPMACRILVPQPGIELMSPALPETTGPPGKPPIPTFLPSLILMEPCQKPCQAEWSRGSCKYPWSVLDSYLESTRHATTCCSLILCPLLSEIGSCHS